MKISEIKPTLNVKTINKNTTLSLGIDNISITQFNNNIPDVILLDDLESIEKVYSSLQQYLLRRGAIKNDTYKR